MRSFSKYSQNRRSSLLVLYLLGIIFILISSLLSLAVGSTDVSLFDILSSSASSDTARKVLLYVRLPRTIAALICGASLSASGAIIQGVLANDLASPSIIGVNSGAAVAVTICCAFGMLGGWQISLFSFIGAFATALVVSLASKRMRASRGSVILMGVAINSILGALQDSILTFVPNISIISADFKVGDFSSVAYNRLFPALILGIGAIAAAISLSHMLDVLTLGDDSARGLGMNTGLVRALFLMIASLLAGISVSIAGLISFVGLIVPHLIRRLGINRSEHLLPLCALYGGGFVALCDMLARSLFSPYELPVGILIAFIGAPIFLLVLFRRKGGEHFD